MNIQVNTDHNIEGSEELNAFIDSSFSVKFDRFSSAITRIVVHLSDENGGKTGQDDKRCLLEARVANHQPIVVTHHANNISEAIEIDSDKLLRSLDSMAGRMTNHEGLKKYAGEAIPSNDED